MLPAVEALPPHCDIGGAPASGALGVTLLNLSVEDAQDATVEAAQDMADAAANFSAQSVRALQESLGLVGGGEGGVPADATSPAAGASWAADDAAAKASANAAYASDDRGRQAAPSSMAAFLAGANLSRHAASLATLGYTDVEDLSDRHILDDQTLIEQVGMSKDDVRALRAKIAKEGSNPTMMRAKRAAGKSGKPSSRGGAEASGASLGSARAQEEQALKDAAAKGSVPNGGGFGDAAADAGAQGLRAMRRATSTFTQSFAFVPGFGAFGGDVMNEGTEDADAEDADAPPGDATAKGGRERKGTMI